MLPSKFKPYYVIQAYSPRTNKLRQQHISTEIKTGSKCADLTTAQHRAREFAKSLSESKAGGANDWQPKLQLQNTESTKIVVPV